MNDFHLHIIGVLVVTAIGFALFEGNKGCAGCTERRARLNTWMNGTWYASFDGFILQGEAGSTVPSLLAVAHIINNRAARKGVPPYHVAVIPGQFISVAPNPGMNAIKVANMLESGTLPPDNTAGALFFVTPVPGQSYDFIDGATGPTTAAIIRAGNQIGPNYFSDNWGVPSDAFNFYFNPMRGTRAW
jgi:hypothetical protein